jgi:soluble lytic murein transglycosylase
MAKIFKYVDSNGIVHLSNAPNSERYQEWKGVRDSYQIKTRKVSPGGKDRFTNIIELASRKYGVNSDLIKAVIKSESNFNPQAISPKGAMGLMQLMPETLELYEIKDPFDPWENIRGGVQHLNHLLDHYNGDLELVLAAYNAGKGRVDQYNGVPPFPETIDYIDRVLYYYQNADVLNNDPAINKDKKRIAKKIFRYFYANGVVLFTNVRQ